MARRLPYTEISEQRGEDGLFCVTQCKAEEDDANRQRGSRHAVRGRDYVNRRAARMRSARGRY